MISPQRSSVRRFTRSQLGLTAIEVLVGIGLLVIVLLLVSPLFVSRYPMGRMADQLNNGRQIYIAMRNYAAETEHEGSFPAFANPKDKTGLFRDSNGVFTSNMPRYIDDKMVFNNKQSHWCKATAKSEDTANTVLPGENDWCYVRGLTNKSDARWPLLANAFVPGTTHYVKDQSKPGGVWKGAKAIVVRAGGAAEIVETSPQGDHFFVKRTDKPTANAFEKDGEWLAGENVQLLYPNPVPH